MKELTIEEIEQIFACRYPDVVGKYKFFSVIVPLVKVNDEVNILFEVRAKDLIKQPGEICLPGGGREKGETPLMCAIRETKEELGVNFEDIRVISKLDTLYEESGFLINCYLVELNVGRMKPSEAEVEETFTVPLKFLLENEPELYSIDMEPNDRGEFPYEKINFIGGYNWRRGHVEVPIYHYKDKVIWGLTGRIIHEFIKVMKGEKL